MPTIPLGKTDLHVTPVAMGCWPIAGITSVNVTRDESLKTLAAAFDSGINFFDSAYCYGYEGESERMIGEVLGAHRDQIVIATKGGIHYEDKKQSRDASPATLHRQCRESLDRLQMDVIDLYYLHAPDPNVPVSESAGAFVELKEAGLIRSVGVSNFNRHQLEEFHAVCPIDAFQPHYNMLQREIEDSTLPWCVEHNVATCVYWPLMKGLLAGKLSRDHKWDPKDGRQKYPMFQGEEWRKNHDFIDEVRTVADEVGRPLVEVVINWTIQRSGITVALCGAKRPEQICQSAAAMEWNLTTDQVAIIDAAIERRGSIQSRAAVSS